MTGNFVFLGLVAFLQFVYPDQTEDTKSKHKKVNTSIIFKFHFDLNFDLKSFIKKLICKVERYENIH